MRERQVKNESKGKESRKKRGEERGGGVIWGKLGGRGKKGRGEGNGRGEVQVE